MPQVCGGDDVDGSEVHLLPLLGDRVLYLVFLRVGESVFLAFFAVEGFDVEAVVSPFLPRRLSVAPTPHTFSHRPQRLFVQLSFFLLPRSNKVLYLGIVDHQIFFGFIYTLTMLTIIRNISQKVFLRNISREFVKSL